MLPASLSRTACGAGKIELIKRDPGPEAQGPVTAAEQSGVAPGAWQTVPPPEVRPTSPNDAGIYPVQGESGGSSSHSPSVHAVFRSPCESLPEERPHPDSISPARNWAPAHAVGPSTGKPWRTWIVKLLFIAFKH